MNKPRKPWTHWAVLIAAFLYIGYALADWLFGLPKLPTWLAMLLFPLIYWDMIKRGDSELAYQDKRLKEEVQRAVKDALAERKPSSRPVDVAFETTEDVTIHAGVTIVPAVRKETR